MDRKGIAILVVCLLVLVAGNWLINKKFPPIKVPVQTNQAAGTANPVEATNVPGRTASSGLSPEGVKFVVNSEMPEETVVFTNQEARYTFTSRGGGLKLVELLKYQQTVSALNRKKKATNEVATLNTPLVAPVMALMGSDAVQGDGVYKLSSISNGVRAEKTLTNGLTITKDFQISPESNYLMTATVRLKNTSDHALELPAFELAAGASTPMGPTDNTMARAAQAVMWYNGTASSQVNLVYFNTNTTTLGIFHHTVMTQYLGGSNNVSWVSAQNQFFALATMAQSNNPASFVAVHMLSLPPPSAEELQTAPRAAQNPQALEASLGYSVPALSPGQQSELKFNLFAGPKDYRQLTKLDDRFQNRIDLIMDFGSFYGMSWFVPISKGLLLTMDWLHDVLKFGYGWIVVTITVILRMVFWPLTRASTRSMKRMQELQPQMKAIQEKYKDDPAKMNAKTWEFYKKNKVNPLGGCLPMMLQIPVFFGFFGMLRNAIELRGAHFLWMGDLSQPDTVFVIPGFNFPVNLMPLMMAGAQFWQASMTPLSPGMDPAQQKMMRYMPLMMVVFFYNYSSGLALYWTVSTLLTVLQTKLTKTKPATAAAPVAAAPARPPQKKK